MTTCQTFPAFLQERGIFTPPQAEKLKESLSDDDENQRVFLLADFFRSLTPSDCYDLALRLCSSYKKALKEIPIKTVSSQPRSPPHQRSPHFLPKKFNNNTHYSPKSVPTSPGSKRRLGSNSPERTDLKSSINYDPKKQVNHLYEESKYREYTRMENENRKYQDEVKECTFQPNAIKMTTPLKGNSRVFERLQQEGIIKKEKEEINSRIKKQLEVKECTFKPKILSNSMKASFDDRNTSRASISTQDKTFDRLYKDYQTKQHSQLENEYKKRTEETQGCTFKPALTARNSSSGNSSGEMTDRFKRLYELHGKKQRTLLNKQVERSEDEDRHCTFKPQILATATPINSGKDVHERLLEWNDNKKRKLNEKIVEKAVSEETMHKDAYLPAKRRNEGATDRSRTSQSPYDRLYQSQEAKRAKKEQLEKKVMKEIGASFTPTTNSKRGHSASKSSGHNNLLIGFPDSKLNSPRDTLSNTQRRSSPTPQYLPRRQSEKNLATAWNYKIHGFQTTRNSKLSPDSKSRVATFGLS